MKQQKQQNMTKLLQLSEVQISNMLMNTLQGLANSVHGDERVCNVHAERFLHA